MLLGEDGAAAGAPEGTLFVDMSTIAPGRRAPHRRGARASAGHGFVDAPVTGSSPKAEDGHADDHGRRQRRRHRARAAAVRGDGRDDRARRRGRPGPGGQGDLQRRQRGQLRRRSRRRWWSAAAAGVDLDALLRGDGRAARRTRRCSQLKGEPMLEHDFTPLFKLEHMLKDVRLCLEEARAAGAPFPSAALARELYAPASAAASASRTSRPCSRSSRAWPAPRLRCTGHPMAVPPESRVIRITARFAGIFCDFGSLCIVCDVLGRQALSP